ILVVTAASLAENPDVIEAPSQPLTSTTTRQKRPNNAINSSPAEIPTRILRVEPPGPLDWASSRKTPPPTPVPAVPRRLASRGCCLLVLARPSAREDGTARKQATPELSVGNQRKSRGNPRKRRDRAATAVSNNRVNEV